jgi:hypothetical protein
MSNIETFDFSVNLLRHLLWQYDSAPNIRQLIADNNTWLAEFHTDFWNSWVVDVFDLATANDFGLSVWSKILDFPLYGESNVSPPDAPAFGFDTLGDPDFESPIEAFESDSGDYGGFFATDTTGLFGLPRDTKRLLLRLKYYKLTTNGTLPEINAFLEYVLGPNELYVLDGLDMTITYVSVGPVANLLLGLFQQIDILPRPAGVSASFVRAGVSGFGFDDYNLNFDNGSFLS